MKEPRLEEVVEAIRNLRRMDCDCVVGNIMEELGFGTTKDEYVWMHLLLAECIRKDLIVYRGVGVYDVFTEGRDTKEPDPEFLECEPHGQLVD